MDVDNIREMLFKKQKSGMLNLLFQKNPKQNEVNISIVLSSDPNSMLVPYRNINCKQLQCLYDEDELVQLCMKNSKNTNYKFSFPCKCCKTKINFQDFYLDEDLYEKINRIFGCYNKQEVVVNEIVLNREGECSLKLLKRPGQYIVRDKTIPSMRDYQDEEYIQMRQFFETKAKEVFVSKDVIINRMGLSLTYEQLELLTEEQTSSVPLMAFLLNYAHNYQENLYEQKGQINTKKNLCIITLIIQGLTAQKQIDADYLTNFENYYQYQELVNNYENVAVVIYYEKTWSLLLVDLNQNQSHFFIFKDHMKDEYAEVVSALIAEQFDLKNSVINYVENFSFHSPTEAKYSGTLVFRLLMWLIDPPGNPQPFSEFSQQTLEIIKKQTTIIEWLLFKMMMQDPKNNHIFEGFKLVQSKKSIDSTMPSIVSLQGILSPPSSNQAFEKESKKKKKKKKKKHESSPILEAEEDQEDNFYEPQEQQEDEQDEILNNFNFQQEFDELKRRYSQNGILNIPKEELDLLVEKLQYDVSKEMKRKKKQEQIEKETLADYYINKKLQEFDLQIKQAKTHKKKKKRKDYDEEEEDEISEDDILAQYERGEITKEDVLEKQQVQLSVGELKTILKQFEVDMNKRIDFKQQNNVQDAIDKERQVGEYMEWYNTFVQLLHYYYNYDIETYKQLIDEYNFRFHSMIFHKLGLDWQASKNSKSNQTNEQSQLYNSSIKQSLQNHSSVYNNSNFKNQFEIGNNSNNNSLRNSYNNNNNNNNNNNKNQNSPIGFNLGSSLALAGMSSINQSISDKNYAYAFGQRYNESVINNENSNIVCQRYEKTITEGDIIKLRSGNILTEDGLNFFIKYLEERQGHQLYLYQLNQKEFPKGMRILYLSSSFYKYFTKENPLQQDNLDFKCMRHYMKPYTGQNNTIFDKFDKIFIPILLSLNEIHLVMINLNKKELILFMTSNFSGHSLEAVNNPILQNIMRFLQKELYEKKMQNLNFLNWEHKYVYLDETFTQKFKQSILNTAFIINMLSKQKEYQTFSQQEYSSFTQRLIKLFYQIGITKNKKNEIVINNMPL
ncbi:hypothetical protein TTHERM_01028800 (macronuclear) [Tetrahymena thermophila SB210]|uniref:Ubiquitin-like protease family profile domain-containing protein n=1 Tax=Tetrahymena thermophila (strain SB210) TaxID=312017 RepID=Q23EG0_TETTS|nr:hypothetical protein TTHERM_01028800 [Tetrahymena thermophila SB210]EAR94897.2 hypothetical protein TTHERM_01028800 [Tetrahymena thermophila SB210]|eukprot:XP_001015142.2 hypothetical protein TTHERM_01028800 [Tetrahymena thermophila SB210]